MGMAPLQKNVGEENGMLLTIKHVLIMENVLKIGVWSSQDLKINAPKGK